MARVTATPNPVGFYGAGGNQIITIEWATEGGFDGLVYAAKNGLIDELIPGQRQNGDRRGTLSFEVTYPYFYYISLKRRDNNIEIAHTTVNTFNLQEQLAENFSQAYIPQLRPQVITDVVVKPGVDTVRISFRTTRPTIPTTELRTSAGAWVDGRMPLFGGLRTAHEVRFGLDRPLALNAKHTFKIEAFGATSNKNSPNKAVLTGEFVTGTRSVDVMFEAIDVHDDGDPGARGKGEFRFSFGAGDPATTALLGDPDFFPGTGIAGVSYDDPPLEPGINLGLASAPRLIWVQVIGTEYDRTLMPWEAGVGFGLRPIYEEPGNYYQGTEVAQQVSVTRIFDLGSTPGRRMIPFEMYTGVLPVAFVVSGHFGVNASVGSVISPKTAKPLRVPQTSAFLTEPGSASGLAVGGVEERRENVALGTDGSLYHQSLKRERKYKGEDSGWTRIDLPGRGAPVVIATGPDTLDVIDLNDDGSVLLCGYDLKKSKPEKWRKLGGKFREIHPAVSAGKIRGGDAGVTLFGVAEDGGVHVRDASAEGQKWDRISNQPARAVTAVSATGARASLFAVSDEGSLVHHSRRDGRWKAEVIGERVPGERPTQLLTTVFIDQPDGKNRKTLRRDLVIGAMSEDNRVRVLRWQGYPAGQPETRWKELGSVQDLLAEDTKGASVKMRGESRPTVPTRRRKETRSAPNARGRAGP